MLETKKAEIISNWVSKVFSDSQSKKLINDKGNLRFDDPLLFEVIREFNMIFDFIASDIENEIIPVAKTLIKFLTLNSEKSSDVIGYPVQLRKSIEQIFLPEVYKNIEILLTINVRIDKLTFSAMDFLLKTREDIYKIKLNELKQGLFANETSGCPSGFLQGEI
jgi:hypothetical protein